MSRDAIVWILYVLISIEQVSTLALVPMSPLEAALFALTILAFWAVCVRMATGQRYRVAPVRIAVVAGAP